MNAAMERRTNPWLVLLLLSAGFFMILLDTTIVNIAIPSIIAELKASLDSILWVLNAYILVYAALLITAGRFGDLYGQKRMFLLGLVVFTLSSAACGAAQNTDQLIAARVVQGIGGALLTPQTLSLLTTIFPPERRGAAFGVWGAVAGVAAVTGPTLGGFLVTYVNWRWIFYVNVPIGVAVIAASLLFVPDIRPGRRHGFDPVGVLLVSTSLFLVCFGLIEGERYGWGHVTSALGVPLPGFVDIRLLIAAGVLIQLLFFLVWEPRQDEPLVPLSLFRERNYSLMNWVSAVLAFSMLGLFLPFVIYLQSVLGFSAIKAGLTMVPMSLVSMPVAPIAGRLADRMGGKYILIFGLTMYGVGMALFDWVASIHSDWYSFTLPAMVAGLGMGCTFAPMTTVAMRNIEPRMAGAASGVFNTTRQLGGVIGSALVGAVLQNRLAAALHDQAVQRGAGLPTPVRQRFVDGFSGAARTGFQVGRGELGGSLPAGVPPQLAHQISQIAHDVFAYGFIDAMRVTLIVPIAAIGVGAASCLAIKRRPRGRAAARAAASDAAAL